jgi:diaminohydroxyphosphoribosylaminopyrimidine deaminase / 5-amino-6-(5-phosphoribosylamino)uracil reductase
MSNPEVFDQRMMRLALREARRGLGYTSPNPAVGAVLVKDGEILATGFHLRAGLPHAEIEAINALGDESRCRGATLYVTLEPCSTSGRTPPCTEAIVRSGITRVVIGAIDPNPAHQRRGVTELRKRGLEVTIGILEIECTRLNAGFNRWISSGTPWVVVKVAQSLDGYLTRPPGETRWLTNQRSRRLVQRLRETSDAILVGGETIRTDDPQLTVRHASRNREQPWRIVMTRSGNLPANAQVFTDAFRDRTLIFRDVSWSSLLIDLGKRGVTRLLVEGGGDMIGQLFDLDLIDEVWCFFAPILSGGNRPSFGGLGVDANEKAKALINPRFRRFGSDVLLTADLPTKRPAIR